MPDTIFCPNCGERISGRARFCPSCGARLQEYAVDAPPKPAPAAGLWSAGGPDAGPPPPARVESPPPPADAGSVEARRAESPPPPAEAPRDDSPPRPAREPLSERIGRVDPQAAELTGIIRDRLALPGIVAAAIAAALAAGIVLLAGLLIAIVAPENSILGVAGFDTSLFKETFRQAVGTLLTAMVEEPGLLVSGTRRIHPLVLAAIPLGALIFATRSQLYRTEGAAPLARLGWASLVAVPFALLMLVFALIGGGSDTTRISPSVGGAFGLGLLWGALGGLIGAATKLPLDTLTARLPDRLTRATVATLRPLAAVLAICTVVGLTGWLIQVGRDVGGVRLERSAPTALVEETLFAGEDGIHLTALAAGARFTADADGALGLPFPVADANDVPGRGGTFRVFAYADALPAAVLVPALVLLMGLVALGALYAGFAAARAVRAPSLQTAALWGALTGPVWAITMAILVVLAGGLFHGDADDTSVFGIFLLGGAVFGAAGGALASNDQATAPGPAESSSS